MKKSISAVGAIVWMAGVVLAHGFWSTFFAVVIPVWGVYLVAEKLLHVMGWI